MSYEEYIESEQSVYLPISRSLSDSPWPMFGGNPQHTGLSQYETKTNNGRLQWQVEYDDYFTTSPIIGKDGELYVGNSDGNLYAFSSNGTLIWKYYIGGQVFSTPALDSTGTIYLGSYNGYIYAINPDGSEKWKFKTEDSISSSPAIDSKNNIVIGSYDHNLYSINSEGDLNWKYNTDNNITSSPAIDHDGNIYIISDNNLTALSSDGIEKWNYNSDNYSIRTTITIDYQNTIYITCGQDRFTGFCIEAISSEGNKKWTFSPTFVRIDSCYGVVKPSIDSEGIIYAGFHGLWGTDSYTELFAIYPNGSEKWNTILSYAMYGSASISSDGTIHVITAFSLNSITTDGNEQWSTSISSSHSTPIIGPDGILYFIDNLGGLFAYGEKFDIRDIEINYEYSIEWKYIEDGSTDFGDETGYLNMNILSESHTQMEINYDYSLPNWQGFFSSYPTNTSGTFQSIDNKQVIRFYDYVDWYGESMVKTQGTYPNTYQQYADIENIEHDGDIWHWKATLTYTGQGSSSGEYEVDYWYDVASKIITHEKGHYEYSGSAETYTGETTTWDNEHDWEYKLIVEEPPNQNPTVSINADKTSGNTPLTINFKAVATDPEGDYLSYDWDFDDGSTSQEKEISHTFDDPGEYNVELTVYDDSGGYNTSTIKIIATANSDDDSENQPPAVYRNADILSGNPPLTVKFTSDAEDSDGYVVSYHWDFDDGETSDEKSPTHTFKNTGFYYVTLTVTDDKGATTVEQIDITVIPDSYNPYIDDDDDSGGGNSGSGSTGSSGGLADFGCLIFIGVVLLAGFVFFVGILIVVSSNKNKAKKESEDVEEIHKKE